MEEERRNSERIKVEVPVRFDIGRNTFFGTTANLCDDGMMNESSLALTNVCRIFNDLRGKERRRSMINKTLVTTLAILFIFPAICLAGDIEVGNIKLRWEKAFGAGCAFWAKIPVMNYANYEYRVIGKLLFYDRDGVEFYGIPFWGDVEARKREVLQANWIISNWDCKKVASLKVAIEANPLSLSASGKRPFRMEKSLTFPPRYNH